MDIIIAESVVFKCKDILHFISELLTTIITTVKGIHVFIVGTVHYL